MIRTEPVFHPGNVSPWNSNEGPRKPNRWDAMQILLSELIRQDNPLERECPKCKARPTYPCFGVRNYEVRKPHPER